MSEATYEVAAVQFWREDGTAALKPLALGSEAMCGDIARRASLGTTDWPAVAVRLVGGQVTRWWVRGREQDQCPMPENNARRRR